MRLRLTPLLLRIVCLSLFGIQSNWSMIIDDIDPFDLIEWHTFSMLSCTGPSTFTIALFDCELPVAYLEEFDEDVCYLTTPEPIETTTPATAPPFILYQCANPNYIGTYCNITNDVCSSSAPCKNGAMCLSDHSLPLKYRCQCLSAEYSGYDCENDNRICKNNTCWHDGECITSVVAAYNASAFDCICKYGYDGSHCELVADMCANITCENLGVCISTYLAWTCRCPDPEMYSGIYCEHQSSALIIKQILSKSFASIAIAAIGGVFVFVIVMDVLKYGFRIDPVDRERQLLRSEREEKRANKGKKQEKCAKIGIWFFYKNYSK